MWLLEHPPLYTSGTSGREGDLLDPRFPLFTTGRGGQVTYHGPGQRVAYVMLDLKRRRPDVRAYVAGLEEWIIRTLDAFNVRGERREDRVGVWVKRPDKGIGHEDKIAAIGVRLRRWVSFHGIAINVEPELSHFAAIVPCGVVDPRYGVTSLVDLGLPVTMEDVDVALRQAFGEVFGATARAPAGSGALDFRQRAQEFEQCRVDLGGPLLLQPVAGAFDDPDQPKVGALGAHPLDHVDAGDHAQNRFKAAGQERRRLVIRGLSSAPRSAKSRSELR